MGTTRRTSNARREQEKRRGNQEQGASAATQLKPRSGSTELSQFHIADDADGDEREIKVIA